MKFFKFTSKVYSIIVFFVLFACAGPNQLEKDFLNPPKQFKPMPFWHINGELTTEGIREQMKDAKELAGFSGISLLPLASKNERQGTTPKFLTESYFDRFQDVLTTAKELDMEVILYDDNDFPSGMAGGIMQEKYPEYCRKRIDKIEKTLQGPAVLSDHVSHDVLMSVAAMNTKSLERIDLKPFIKNGILKWVVPEGEWKIMYFPLITENSHKKYLIVDILDTLAVRKMINHTYDEYYNRFGSYFGNTIKTTFFDDVGFWKFPRTWTSKFNEKFKELNGFDPEPYYPALWYHIGPDTEAIRYAFYLTRAELLAEGFPKLAADWAKKHQVKDTGHPPGNYDPTPIDMNGDIFKFFRHTAIPLTDAIIRYQFGQNGHKLISSAADYYDKPLVSTEIYGAYRDSIFDSNMLYRPMMDLFVRGVNMVIPHGLWYNPEHVYIPPLVSPYNDKIAGELPTYSDFVGRSAMLLRGGRRISEIGLLYPFESLAGWYRFEAEENPRQGFFVSPETDYQKISGILTNEIRRDFTFVHPEFLLDEKYVVQDGSLKLDNKENFQVYNTIIISGCNIISYRTLEKLKLFYENGGTLISTTQLPFKSTELGNDAKIIEMIKGMFKIDPLNQNKLTEVSHHQNQKGGNAIFIPKLSSEVLEQILEKYTNPADVWFLSNPKLKSDFGKFSYIHKIKDGKNIFYFSNSSDEVIQTEVCVKGILKLEQWNPHNGEINKDIKLEYIKTNNQDYTKFKLRLEPVASVFYVSS
ncbi:glycosyl hydrolase [Namhaeicola litoreus]|uniref:Glycosyl hydrolase n=1 Tax=Namhaeicola litoreus TaxID=1052145 RepID=A0ABW3Y5N9_9FLAO